MKKDHPTPQSRRAKIVYFFWNNIPRFFLLLLLGLIVFLGFVIEKEKESIASNKAAAISNEKPPVNTVTLKLSPTVIHDRINLPGSIEPWTDLQLLAKISGTVTKLLVNEGDKVKKGDILATLEEDDYRIALDRAKAAYNQAKADYQRDRSIFKKGGIPTAALESRKTVMQTAKADVEHAELQLSRCKILSPMDGVIKTMDAKIGLLLSIGDPVARILEIDRLKAVVGIPESDVSGIRQLNTVKLIIQALDEQTFIGKKHFLSPAPESVARLYNLELEIENKSGAILPGMFVRADIIKKSVADAITVPFYSVISRNNEQFVYVEKEGVVEKRPVTLGIMEEWMVEITKGLSKGENLVVEGHRDIETGQKVRVVKTADTMEGLRL